MADPIISHIGIAVKDLEQSIVIYEALTGLKARKIEEVPEQKVRVAFFSSSDDINGGNIELVAPTAEDSPVGRFIAKRGGGLHHICIYVENLESRLEALKATGIELIDEVPRIGAEGNAVAFVHPSGTNGVLIELEENPDYLND